MESTQVRRKNTFNDKFDWNKCRAFITEFAAHSGYQKIRDDNTDIVSNSDTSGKVWDLIWAPVYSVAHLKELLHHHCSVVEQTNTLKI